MIKYTPEFNARIRKDVRHFNQVRKTLSKRGIKLTPQLIKVSDLKARYSNKEDLEKELKLLRNIRSNDDRLLKEVETKGGVTAIKWNLEFLKQNTRNAIKYFEWERELEQAKNPKYPHELARTYEIDANLKILQMDIDYMNQDQFKSYNAAIREFFLMQEHMRRGYRGFLYQVETAMRTTGFSNTQINSVFKELKKLNPSEFHQWYESNDLIKRIYELVPSDPYGTNKLTTSEDDARDLLDDFFATYKEEIELIKSQ